MDLSRHKKSNVMVGMAKIFRFGSVGMVWLLLSFFMSGCEGHEQALDLPGEGDVHVIKIYSVKNAPYWGMLRDGYLIAVRMDKETIRKVYGFIQNHSREWRYPFKPRFQPTIAIVFVGKDDERKLMLWIGDERTAAAMTPPITPKKPSLSRRFSRKSLETLRVLLEIDDESDL